MEVNFTTLLAWLLVCCTTQAQSPDPLEPSSSPPTPTPFISTADSNVAAIDSQTTPVSVTENTPRSNTTSPQTSNDDGATSTLSTQSIDPMMVRTDQPTVSTSASEPTSVAQNTSATITTSKAGSSINSSTSSADDMNYVGQNISGLLLCTTSMSTGVQAALNETETSLEPYVTSSTSWTTEAEATSSTDTSQTTDRSTSITSAVTQSSTLDSASTNTPHPTTPSSSSSPSSPSPSSTYITSHSTEGTESQTTGDTDLTTTSSSTFSTPNTATAQMSDTTDATKTTNTDINTSTAMNSIITVTSQTISSTRITNVQATTGITTLDKEEDKSNALSSGSITVLIFMLALVIITMFGGLYYYRIRRASSYGTLLNSNDHNNLANFSNPMYDP
ncbi:cell wall protein DAN4 [Melanotaenia boesemani]|uniref:cell wall protein DAN4 n=1 Tax=Melanotaenia boesemani TaxID=1250792 RepID=UPI001C054B38|nr:cell wall protein DAN4 [Melanotaenia boesemani]